MKCIIKTKIDLKKRMFSNFFFFLTHIMDRDMRQKLWVCLLTTGLKVERDQACVQLQNHFYIFMNI